MQKTLFQIPVLKQLLRGVALLIMKCTGWKVEFDKEQLGSIQKAVLIGAPHTSNWDFPMMLLGVLIMRLPVNWIGKHTLFKGPMGPVMRFLGGIAIDRRAKRNFVEQIVQKFNGSEQLLLIIAPEGTRKAVPKWKSGFYYMAYNADVPLILAYVDYGKKTMGVMAIEQLSGDAEADIQRYQQMYLNVQGKNPKNYYPYSTK